MLSVVTVSYLPYKWKVDYWGFNEAIRVTLVSYHQSGMQDASTSNQSLSTTLTLQLLLSSSWIKNKALKQVVNLMNNINKKLTWIRSWLPEKSHRQAQIELESTKVQAIESTNRIAPPPNSSLTLYLTISIYKTRSYEGLIFSWLLALILKIWIRVSGIALLEGVQGCIYRG